MNGIYAKNKAMVYLAFTLFICLIWFIYSRSLNRYEEEAVGTYYEVISADASDKNIPNDTTVIELHSDRSYTLKRKGETIIDSWKADDYGDWTLLEIQYQGYTVQGVIGKDSASGNDCFDLIPPFLSGYFVKRE